ncbi:DUF1322 domain-containing protein (plasmid) [Borrelia miyamotoi]|uniref:DUF1322 family protein n=1 Tax=Borrelia miyamotoi TaxID=47466 RepID=A0AAP8YWZ7_9SPIR|nr:DUF1322 family protein [Borrelia miyamotoi]AHH05460.1 Hypothetical protein BOM_0917 [Borrelia miyamotoi FR64b]ATQ15255.1 DUF1322 family protein [Borrelia miyamotoi]ATQ16433.1 DUF1322 family protein [Borrelia miyamotoi]ATQ17584.1 DUF1322 family protein [Borrelia miyamotoi]ATQ18828.1 DUF1322 family protein [Borrelia miyamotoi]
MNHDAVLDEYFAYLKYLRSEACKYYFPVLMGICTFDEIKRLKYKELLEINKIANIKLKKEIYENFLISRRF